MCESKKIEDWWEEIMRPKSITSSFSWTDLGWEEPESRTATVGKRKSFPQTLFSFSRFGKKCFFYQVQEAEWVLPAPHHRCSPSMGKFCQQHIIIGFIQANIPPARGHRSHNPTEIIWGCVRTWPLAWGGVFAFPVKPEDVDKGTRLFQGQ